MRISKLPPTIRDELTVSEGRGFLRKTQRYYCDRMTYHKLCPRQCWRCYPRLTAWAEKTAHADNKIAYWQRVLQGCVAELVEEEHTPKADAMTMQEAAESVLNEL